MLKTVDVFREETIYRLNNLWYVINHRSILGAKTGFKDNQARIILVNGTQKTGTTWCVHLLNSVPGNVWWHKFGPDFHLLSEAKPGQVLHGHHPYCTEIQSLIQAQDVRVIIMVRDPRDQVVSNLFHLRRDTSNVWHAPFLAMSLDEGIYSLVEGRPAGDGRPCLPSVNDFFKISLSWQTANPPVLFVRYEDLLQDTMRELQRILDYLDIKLSTSLQKSIVERNRFERLSIGRKLWKPARKSGQEDRESHFRKGIQGDWKNYFTDQHMKCFKKLSGDLLIQLGYESGQDW